ncbi:Uncharacterized protein TCM_012499 [Theobroma cacao]|uniref:Uncharacterized protein n=1 Tax=Theobroma cacao TaxID=3641 RepID=A0A061G277_THECC|nr:Uncharacterized protein TCM_012499 [Theobroma cacao]
MELVQGIKLSFVPKVMTKSHVCFIALCIIQKTMKVTLSGKVNFNCYPVPFVFCFIYIICVMRHGQIFPIETKIFIS